MNFHSRREWLLRMSGVTAVMASPEGRFASLAAAPAHRMMTIAFTPASIGVEADQRESIDLAHYFGFESVQPFASELAESSDSELEDLRQELRAKRLQWAIAGLPVNFRADESTFQQDLRKAPRLLAALERAGATRLGTWIMPTHATLPYLRNFKRHARRLREAAIMAEHHGLRLGFEYVGTQTLMTRDRYPFIHTMAETKDLIAEIGRPNLGFVLDSWHWWTAGDSVADLLTLTNNDVVSCDLNDAPKGIPKDEQIDNQRELPMATGVIDIGAFLGALQKIGYDGPVRAEPFNAKLNALPNAEACAATIQAMKKAFAVIDG